MLSFAWGFVLEVHFEVRRYMFGGGYCVGVGGVGVQIALVGPDQFLGGEPVRKRVKSRPALPARRPAAVRRAQWRHTFLQPAFPLAGGRPHGHGKRLAAKRHAGCGTG
jgi:hypothetical protein